MVLQQASRHPILPGVQLYPVSVCIFRPRERLLIDIYLPGDDLRVQPLAALHRCCLHGQVLLQPDLPDVLRLHVPEQNLNRTLHEINIRGFPMARISPTPRAGRHQQRVSAVYLLECVLDGAHVYLLQEEALRGVQAHVWL